MKKNNFSIFSKIWKFIDKKIIVPITKLILYVTDKTSSSSKWLENWLSKKNTLIFISLFLAFAVFIIIDQKILIFQESSAEVLKKQTVRAIYNEEAYVVEGLPETVDITLIGSKTDLYIAKQSPINDVKVDVKKNMDKMLTNIELVSNLEDKSNALKEMAHEDKTGGRELKRASWRRNKVTVVAGGLGLSAFLYFGIRFFLK